MRVLTNNKKNAPLSISWSKERKENITPHQSKVKISCQKQVKKLISSRSCLVKNLIVTTSHKITHSHNKCLCWKTKSCWRKTVSHKNTQSHNIVWKILLDQKKLFIAVLDFEEIPENEVNPSSPSLVQRDDNGDSHRPPELLQDSVTQQGKIWLFFKTLLLKNVLVLMPFQFSHSHNKCLCLKIKSLWRTYLKSEEYFVVLLVTLTGGRSY